jgi:hypothetical protein
MAEGKKMGKRTNREESGCDARHKIDDGTCSLVWRVLLGFEPTAFLFFSATPVHILHLPRRWALSTSHVVLDSKPGLRNRPPDLQTKEFRVLRGEGSVGAGYQGNIGPSTLCFGVVRVSDNGIKPPPSIREVLLSQTRTRGYSQNQISAQLWSWSSRILENFLYHKEFWRTFLLCFECIPYSKRLRGHVFK